MKIERPAIHQAASLDLPIDRGRPGPGLLAHLLVNKYGADLPLYRQAEIFARSGVDLGRSTLAGWVGQAAFALRPLVDAIAGHVLAADKIHGDDTTVPVLAPGTGKTKTGRLWVYVRDDRPWCGQAPPAAFCGYSPDRRADHPLRHLAGFGGILQADGYAGFNELYRQNAVVEVACWAHVRRKFFDFHVATNSPLAAIALQRIAALYEIEDGLRGRPAKAHRTRRAQRAGPVLDQFQAWLEYCILLWAPTLLETVDGLPRTTAATATVSFSAAMLIARLAGSGLFRFMSERLFIAALRVGRGGRRQRETCQTVEPHLRS